MEITLCTRLWKRSIEHENFETIFFFLKSSPRETIFATIELFLKNNIARYLKKKALKNDPNTGWHRLEFVANHRNPCRCIIDVPSRTEETSIPSNV